MNVALTSICNQRCPYCFAIDAMSIADCTEISIKNLKLVMDFLKRSGITKFRMAGGEPTLHSKFQEVYNIVSANNFSVNILSNGIIDEDKADFLSKKDNLDGILLNINHPRTYPLIAWKKITDIFSKLNKKIILNFRIYKLNFNLRFLFDLIDKYNLNRLINLAIACPSLMKDNIFIKLEYHKRVIEKMAAFSYESKKRNISWNSDSGFILCAFDEGKLKKLHENTGFRPITNCIAAIEVAPDLRVFRCFGLAAKSNENIRLTDFENFQEIAEYFTIKSLPLKRIGALDKCFKCAHLINHMCGGGCLVHVLKKFPNYKRMSAIF